MALRSARAAARSGYAPAAACQSVRCGVNNRYGDAVSDEDLGRLRDAYVAAWETRQQTGDDSPALLVERLAASRLEVFSAPGPGRDLMLSLWERGVPPEALERELRRAAPGMALTALRAVGRSAREIAIVFHEGGQLDFSWMDLPGGKRKLSDARKVNDLVLRWLHPRVDEVALDLRVDEAAADLIGRCRQFPSANRDGWAEAYCWLLPEDGPNVQVMIGMERIGWAQVPDDRWPELKREEQRRVYSDGSVFLHHYGPEIELVCYLPRAT